MVQLLAYVAIAASLTALTSAVVPLEKRMPVPTIVKRQQASITTGAFSAYSGTLPASISSIIATITSGTAASVTIPTPKSTYSAGALNPSISNAPPLPQQSAVIISQFPALDRIPNSTFAPGAALLATIDLSDVPDIPITNGTCTGQSAASAAQNHWWTCGGHTASSDVTVCPNRNTWGLSYDDGPSPYTPQLLDYLESVNLKTTFFVVGSRAISYQDVLRYEYMNGHQLSVHTWSHPMLTTLTNEQIALELMWTKEIIRQVTGVTPLTMRPPFGDIDDRVRAICKKLSLTPIIWTGNYNTNDYQIGNGQASAASVVANFTAILDKAASLDTGYIVLEHDLYKQSVELAVEVVLPAALAKQPKQTLEPIVQCLNLQLGDAYVETNRNISGSGGASSPGASNPSSNTTAGGSASGTGNLGTGSANTRAGNAATLSSFTPRLPTLLAVAAGVAYAML